MISRSLKIIRKIQYSRNIFGLEFRYPRIRPVPGQFFQVQVDKGVDPFLNRPISVASYKGSRLLLVVKIVGRGTKMLSLKNPGDEITLFGPFGKKVRFRKKAPLLVAGGIGVAPLHFLGEYYWGSKIPFDLLYGVRSKHDFVLRKEMARMADRSIFVAEHGLARKDTVISAIRRMMLNKYESIYTCGPKPMLIELQKLRLPLPVYAFCEDFLGCGCGLCLGCAIKYRGEYKRICVDGPVLELGAIDFEV
jgi:dihydroorotate dehydrogenase electron transfer subunit